MDIQQQTAEQVKQVFLSGNIPSALQLAEQHLQTYPNNVVLLKVKAYCLMEQKRHREAVVLFHGLDQTLSESKGTGDPSIKANLGTCYFVIGFYDKAADYFKQAIKITYDGEWAVNLANCYAELGLYELAILTLQRASQSGYKGSQGQENRLPELFIRCLKDAGRLSHALHVINALPATDKAGKHRKALFQADILVALNQPEKTETLLAEQIENDNPDIEILQRLHNIYRALGNKTKEIDVVKQLLAKDPSQEMLANCMLAAAGEAEPEAVATALQNSALRDDEKARCHFIIADAFKLASAKNTSSKNAASENSDLKKWFSHIEHANHLQNTQPANMKLYQQIFALVKQASGDIPALTKANIADADTLPTPVFILGMPRSGTTLVETLLGNHSNVFAAGETPLIDSLTASMHASIPEIINGHAMRTWYLRDNTKFTPPILSQVAKSYLETLNQYRTTETFVTDKMPHNFLHLGLILKIFPHAKIIHCERDPLSTCISVYEQNFSQFHDYGRNLSTLGDYYLHYHQLMQYFKASDQSNSSNAKILTVQYEQVVANPAEELAKIQQFIGLSPEQITDKNQRRTILTSSNEQATQGVYTGSLNRETGLEAEFAPLKAKLASLYH